jgi:hypothetical protein
MSQRHTSKIKRTLTPGKPGTKKFVAEYGDRLVCARYRYDAERQCKLTTVEVIADCTPWEPDPQRIPANKVMSLNVEYGEVEVGRAVRSAGGTWDKQQKVWKLAYQQVVTLGLTDRIVHDTRDGKTGSEK